MHVRPLGLRGRDAPDGEAREPTVADEAGRPDVVEEEPGQDRQRGAPTRRRAPRRPPRRTGRRAPGRRAPRAARAPAGPTRAVRATGRPGYDSPSVRQAVRATGRPCDRPSVRQDGRTPGTCERRHREQHPVQPTGDPPRADPRPAAAAQAVGVRRAGPARPARRRGRRVVPGPAGRGAEERQLLLPAELGGVDPGPETPRRRSRPTTSLPGFLVYQRQGGLTAPDRAKIASDVQALRGLDGVAGEQVGAPQVSADGSTAAVTAPLIAKRGDAAVTGPELAAVQAKVEAQLKTDVPGRAHGAHRRPRRPAQRADRGVPGDRRHAAARRRDRGRGAAAHRLPQPGAVVLPVVQRGAVAGPGLDRGLLPGRRTAWSPSTGRARASCRSS